MCEIMRNIKEVGSVKMAEIYTHTHIHTYTHTHIHTYTHLNSAKQNINEINIYMNKER